MTHRGKRSKQKQLEQKLSYNLHTTAIKYIFHTAKVDNIHAEVVNNCTFNDVLTELQSNFGTLIMHAIPDLPKGLVLIDSRGNGVFQQINLATQKWTLPNYDENQTRISNIEAARL
jgi:hypothetical protein